MHGNVWEWVNDWMSNFTASRKVDPMGPAKGESKVYKEAALLIILMKTVPLPDITGIQRPISMPMLDSELPLSIQ